MYPNVHCSTIYNIQSMEATYMSTDRKMDKVDMVHIYNGVYYSAIKSEICHFQWHGWT